MDRMTNPAVMVMNHLVESARSKNCADVQKGVQLWLRVYGKQREAIFKDLLNAIDHKRFDFVAIEQSPSSLNWFATMASRFHGGFQVLRDACPRIEPALNRLELMVEGPELYAVNRANGALQLEILEDLSLMEAGQAILVKLDAFKNPLRGQAKRVFRQLTSRAVQEGNLIPSDSEIDEIIRAEPKTERRSRIRAYLEIYRSLQKLAHKRNQFITSQLLLRGGNHAIIIGEAHVIDLYRELDRACHAKMTGVSNQSFSDSIFEATR